MPVLDASVVVEVLTVGRHGETAEARILDEEKALWAPELLDAEVGSALRGGVRRKTIDVEQAADALEGLRRLPVHRVSHERLAQFAWLLRDNVSFYDGLYVALAQLLDQPLLTFDGRLARAGVDVEIEVLAQA
ncbi:MAG: type II toxin-antitoxin system VapC family toxin [Solirubrobacterales bacterium]